jgi:pimeloyl-ACP methyl ester carboxylesterase
MTRQAPERVIRLALLDTSSRADAPERAEGRRQLIALAERHGARKAQEQLLPALVHKSRLTDKPMVNTILQMGEDTGVEALKRQQAAIMNRPDKGPFLPSIRCPTLVLVGAKTCSRPWSCLRKSSLELPTQYWRSYPSAATSPRSSDPRQSTVLWLGG